MLDLLVPLKGGLVFSVQHFAVLVRGVVQAAELLNSQKRKAPSALWPPLQTLFLCPCSKSLSTQQTPSKTLIQSCPSQYRPVRGSFLLPDSIHTSYLCHHPRPPLLTGAPAVGLFSLSALSCFPGLLLQVSAHRSPGRFLPCPTPACFLCNCPIHLGAFLNIHSENEMNSITQGKGNY